MFYIYIYTHRKREWYDVMYTADRRFKNGNGASKSLDHARFDWWTWAFQYSYFMTIGLYLLCKLSRPSGHQERWRALLLLLGALPALHSARRDLSPPYLARKPGSERPPGLEPRSSGPHVPTHRLQETPKKHCRSYQITTWKVLLTFVKVKTTN